MQTQGLTEGEIDREANSTQMDRETEIRNRETNRLTYILRKDDDYTASFSTTNPVETETTVSWGNTSQGMTGGWTIFLDIRHINSDEEFLEFNLDNTLSLFWEQGLLYRQWTYIYAFLQDQPANQPRIVQWIMELDKCHLSAFKVYRVDKMISKLESNLDFRPPTTYVIPVFDNAQEETDMILEVALEVSRLEGRQNRIDAYFAEDRLMSSQVVHALAELRVLNHNEAPVVQVYQLETLTLTTIENLWQNYLSHKYSEQHYDIKQALSEDIRAQVTVGLRCLVEASPGTITSSEGSWLYWPVGEIVNMFRKLIGQTYIDNPHITKCDTIAYGPFLPWWEDNYYPADHSPTEPEIELTNEEKDLRDLKRLLYALRGAAVFALTKPNLPEKSTDTILAHLHGVFATFSGWLEFVRTAVANGVAPWLQRDCSDQGHLRFIRKCLLDTMEFKNCYNNPAVVAALRVKVQGKVTLDFFMDELFNSHRRATVLWLTTMDHVMVGDNESRDYYRRYYGCSAMTVPGGPQYERVSTPFLRGESEVSTTCKGCDSVRGIVTEGMEQGTTVMYAPSINGTRPSLRLNVTLDSGLQGAGRNYVSKEVGDALRLRGYLNIDIDQRAMIYHTDNCYVHSSTIRQKTIWRIRITNGEHVHDADCTLHVYFIEENVYSPPRDMIIGYETLQLLYQGSARNALGQQLIDGPPVCDPLQAHSSCVRAGVLHQPTSATTQGVSHDVGTGSKGVILPVVNQSTTLNAPEIETVIGVYTHREKDAEILGSDSIPVITNFESLTDFQKYIVGTCTQYGQVFETDTSSSIQDKVPVRSTPTELATHATAHIANLLDIDALRVSDPPSQVADTLAESYTNAVSVIDYHSTNIPLLEHNLAEMTTVGVRVLPL